MSAQRPGAQTASVLLATYNRRRLLPAVLAPILGDPATDELVVVVDGSRDGSLELLQTMASEDPRLKPLFVANGGAPRALLTGARAASGDILVILDDDEVVDPATITGHLRHHQQRGDGLVVVGYVEMDLPPSRRPGDFTRYKYAKAYEADTATYEHDPQTILRNLWGGFLSMRRSDYLQVMGEVDEFVEGYHYDLDFGARCIEAGFRAVFDRSLRARHLYERDRAGFLRDARSSGRNRILVHQAHPDVLGRIDATFMEAGLPQAARRALQLALRHRQIARLVDLGTAVAGRLHLWRLETLGATFTWMVEQKRGALEVTSGEQRAPAPSGGP